MPKKQPKESSKSKKSDKKKSTDSSKAKNEKKNITKAVSESKSVKKVKSDEKKTKTSTKTKSVKKKEKIVKAKPSSKEKTAKPKATSKAKNIKKEELAKKTKSKSVKTKTLGKSTKDSKKTAAIREKDSIKVKKIKPKETVPEKIDEKADNKDILEIPPDQKKNEKKTKVKELRENLIQIIEAYDKAALEINGSKNLPKLDKIIPFDDKKHNEICELAARYLAQESRSYKEYFLVMMLPGLIWDEIEKAETELSITKLKELAKAYHKNEIDDKKVIEIFKEIIEKNLTTAAVKEKIKSA